MSPGETADLPGHNTSVAFARLICSAAHTTHHYAIRRPDGNLSDYYFTKSIACHQWTSGALYYTTAASAAAVVLVVEVAVVVVVLVVVVVEVEVVVVVVMVMVEVEMVVEVEVVVVVVMMVVVVMVEVEMVVEVVVVVMMMVVVVMVEVEMVVEVVVVVMMMVVVVMVEVEMVVVVVVVVVRCGQEFSWHSPEPASYSSSSCASSFRISDTPLNRSPPQLSSLVPSHTGTRFESEDLFACSSPCPLVI
ncbi:hypothetical protein AAFF_G00213320 [Aldrovandia affinis]|uniref:Transmembrane protein n=1 Tax=Aldrovandia affinis TaxID=143900 RepID=A0AAD7RGN4_9TELE|nr:hypothetical protein AAFF_G00213320 [Aldrovandia affinis]